MAAALKSNLTISDNYNKLSLSGGYTASVEAERVSTQAALGCAEKHFDEKEKQGIPILTALMAVFGISSRAKKTSTYTSYSTTVPLFYYGSS